MDAGADAQGTSAHVNGARSVPADPERAPFSSLAHVLVGEPASTSPEHTLAAAMPWHDGLACRGAVAARSEAVIDSPDERIFMDFHRELGDEKRREAVLHALEFHVVILTAECPVARIREFY